MNADARASVKKSFINRGQVRVLVLSYLTENEGLNLHYNCQNSVMVEQGINYSMEHQAWSRVWRIGQQQMQHTTRLINLTTIDQLIGNTQWMKPSPMLYALGVLQNAASEDIDLDAVQVYHTLSGKISPQALRSAVIGQYNDVIMDLSEFVIFLYVPFWVCTCFPSGLVLGFGISLSDSQFWSLFGFLG